MEIAVLAISVAVLALALVMTLLAIALPLLWWRLIHREWLKLIRQERRLEAFYRALPGPQPGRGVKQVPAPRWPDGIMDRQLIRQGEEAPNYTRDPGSVWIDKHRSSLPANEWVAANGSGIVAHDSSMGGLMAKLKSEKVDPANVTIAYNSLDSL